MEPPILTGSPEGGDATQSGLIKETTTESFVADVLEASREAVVLVDFWAPWCGPCKQLTPVLESAVKAADGAVRLVKLNIDDHPAVASQMGIRSIPAVFAFADGRPVDGFMGAVSESQVKEFIARLISGAAGEGTEPGMPGIEDAEAALEAGDAEGAAQAFAAVLKDDRTNARALAGLAKCYIRTGDLERAEQTLGMAVPEDANSAAIEGARAMLELARKSSDVGDAEALRARVEADGNDFQARYDLALALSATGDRAGAAEQLLAIVAADRDWNGGAARTQLLQFFDAWGPNDPATAAGRQKLSSLLFA